MTRLLWTSFNDCAPVHSASIRFPLQNHRLKAPSCRIIARDIVLVIKPSCGHYQSIKREMKDFYLRCIRFWCRMPMFDCEQSALLVGPYGDALLLLTRELYIDIYLCIARSKTCTIFAINSVMQPLWIEHFIRQLYYCDVSFRDVLFQSFDITFLLRPYKWIGSVVLRDIAVQMLVLTSSFRSLFLL